MLKRIFQQLGLSTKLSIDLIYNLVSFAIMSVVGILLNTVITNAYGSAGLGVFNQVYAFYLFLSQVAVGGVHLSVLKYAAQFNEDDYKRRVIFTSGVLVTAGTALVVVLLIFPLTGWIGTIFKSEQIGHGIVVMLPGLFFFSLNKVILAFANARRQMKSFAIFQATRYLLMLVSLLVLVSMIVPVRNLPLLFTVAELILFILLLGFYGHDLKFDFSEESRAWYKEHFTFGIKAMGGNLMLNTFNKIDILILGLFASDAAVGVYSFAAMLVEGYNQLSVVIRNLVNPIMTTTYAREGTKGLQQLTRKVRRYSAMVLMPLGLMAVLAFPLLQFFMEKGFVMQAWIVFAGLMLGAIASQGYMPLQMVFNQVGRPGTQTLLIGWLYVTEILLNLILVPFFGLFGSTAATGITFAMQIVYMRLFSRRYLGVTL